MAVATKSTRIKALCGLIFGILWLTPDSVLVRLYSCSVRWNPLHFYSILEAIFSNIFKKLIRKIHTGFKLALRLPHSSQATTR